MTVDQHLRNVLARNHVDMGPKSPVLKMRAALLPLLQEWAGTQLLSVEPSGSFAKGTAVRSGTDIDLFISLAHGTAETLQQIHNTLIKKLESKGFSPRRQTVSIGIRAGNNTYDVDLVPAKKRDDTTGDHSLYHRKSGSARKTNVARHIAEVLPSGRLDEIRLLKIWRNRHRLEFPSFYLELTTIAALAGRPFGELESNIPSVFTYLRDTFPNARVVDPAVPSNAVSDDLTLAERIVIKNAAIAALNKSWTDVFA
jgi:hypothetical protein